jgi:hypothetical protein
MKDMLWRGIARIVTIHAVTDWLIARGQRTPYRPITSRDGSDTYMVRLWLFNAYPNEGDTAGWERWQRSWRRHVPSVRIHHILRADDDDHMHDHPWNARTIVLRGGYEEERPITRRDEARTVHWRARGYTGRLLFGQYHRISHVPPEGVWTLFTTWQKRGTWGFLVDGEKVPYRQYLGLDA